MTSNSTGMYINRMQEASTKLAWDDESPSTFSHLITHWVPSGDSKLFNELVGEQVWRIDRYGNYPCSENEEGTQLGSDEW